MSNIWRSKIPVFSMRAGVTAGMIRSRNFPESFTITVFFEPVSVVFFVSVIPFLFASSSTRDASFSIFSSVFI